MLFTSKLSKKNGGLTMDLNEITTLEQYRKAWLKWQETNSEDGATLSDDEILLAWEADWKIASGEIEL